MTGPEIRDAEISRGGIRGRACRVCYVCGAEGAVLYRAMPDRLFGVPGEWNVMRCSNRECRSLWLDPMPLEEDLIKLYSTYFTHEPPPAAARPRTARARLFDVVKAAYLCENFGRSDLEEHALPGSRPGLRRKIAALPAHLHPTFQARISFPLRAIGRTNGGHLLDIGCGNGALLDLAQRLGWQVTGLDFDPAAVANARRRGLRVLLGGVEEHGFTDGTFDLVVMNHVIEHLPDPVSTLRHCRRILASGGALLVATPNSQCWGHSVFRANWLGLDVPRHLHVFSRKGLKAITTVAGFTRISVSTIPRFAQYYFFEGARLDRDRRFRPERRSLSPARRIPPRTAVLLESLLARLWPSAGEELIMKAEG